LRHMLFSGRGLEGIAPYVPESTMTVLSREWQAGRAPVSWESFGKPLLTQLLRHTPDQLAQYCEVTEGLEHRIKQALPYLTEIGSSGAAEQLISLIKTKRYTRTKLQRMLLRILLNHTKDQLTADLLRQGVPYLRVLGFTGKGRELLKQMKTTARVPVITKVTGQVERSLLLDWDIQATSVYALAYSSASGRDCFRDYYEPPVQL